MIIKRILFILASVFHFSWILGKPLSEKEANGANEVTNDSGSTSETLLPVSITLEKTFAENSGEASGFDVNSASGAGKRDSAVGQNNIPGFSSKQKEEETIEEVVEDTPEEDAQTEEENSADNNVEPISQNAEPSSLNADLQITEEISQKPIELIMTEKRHITSGETAENYAASHTNNLEESGMAEINERSIGSGEDDASSRQSSEENQEEEMADRREPDEEERVETSNDEAETKGYEELQDAKRNVIFDASNDDTSPNTFKQKRDLEEDVVIPQRYPYIIQPVAPSYDLMAQANDVVEVDEGDE